VKNEQAQNKSIFHGEKFVGGLLLIIFISLLLFGSTDLQNINFERTPLDE